MPNILIVDDEKPIRIIIGRILKHNGFDYDRASSTFEAINLLKNKHYDLVLSDIEMPEESGISLMTHVLIEYPEIPVILVTVFDDPGMAESAFEIGADGYVAKPFTENDILIEISNVLQRRKKEKKNKIYREKLETRLQQRTKELKNAKCDLEITKTSLDKFVNKLDSVTTYANDAIIMIDNNGLISYWNYTAEKFFGLKSEQVLTRPFIKCRMNWEWLNIIKGLYNCLNNNVSIQLDDISFINPNGKDSILKIFLSPVFGNDNKRTGVIFLGSDITALKELENQTAGSKNMESVGKLSAGIVDEINIPLQNVTNNTRFLQKSFLNLTSLLTKYELLLDNKNKNGTEDVENFVNEGNLKYLAKDVPATFRETIAGLESVTNIIEGMKKG